MKAEFRSRLLFIWARFDAAFRNRHFLYVFFHWNINLRRIFLSNVWCSNSFTCYSLIFLQNNHFFRSIFVKFLCTNLNLYFSTLFYHETSNIWVAVQNGAIRGTLISVSYENLRVFPRFFIFKGKNTSIFSEKFHFFIRNLWFLMIVYALS